MAWFMNGVYEPYQYLYFKQKSDDYCCIMFGFSKCKAIILKRNNDLAVKIET